MEAITKELHASNEKMQLLMEQVILGKQNRFGRSSEKMEDTSQICFREVDGTIVFFNEAEAVCDLNAAEPEDLELKSPKQPKRKGKKEADLSGLPFRRIDHYLSEEELELCCYELPVSTSVLPMQNKHPLFLKEQADAAFYGL